MELQTSNVRLYHCHAATMSRRNKISCQVIVKHSCQSHLSMYPSLFNTSNVLCQAVTMSCCNNVTLQHKGTHSLRVSVKIGGNVCLDKMKTTFKVRKHSCKRAQELKMALVSFGGAEILCEKMVICS